MRSLERAGKLNRALEFLPDDEEVANRHINGKGLTRPEISILHSYAKIVLYEELLVSEACEDPYLRTRLKNYFPVPLRERYESYMERHPLHREIIATFFTNTLVNATGITMLQRFREQFQFSTPEITQAYLAAREIFNTVEYRRKVQALDNRVPAEMQISMTIEAGRLIERGTLWLLQNQQRPLNIDNIVERYRHEMDTLMDNILSIVTSQHRTAIDDMTKQYTEAGVETGLATRCGTMRAFYSGLDIVEVAINAGIDVLDVGRIYFRVGQELQLFWLREQVSSLEGDYWQRLAAEGLYSDLFRHQRLITAEVIRDADTSQDTDVSHDNLLSAWQQQHDDAISRFNRVLSEIKDAPQLNLAMVSVALRELEHVIN